jgi:translation initiation factor 2 subunit 3
LKNTIYANLTYIVLYKQTMQVNINEIKQNQAIMNVGMIGSVSNGKSSIVYKLTGIKTQKHSDEQKKNITMKLGYANTKIYKCETCPSSYQATSSNINAIACPICNSNMLLKTHISLVDCPGHHQLMATMLNGTCVMDSTILVESAYSTDFPSQQTKEHLQAIQMIGLKTPITCLNKLDIVPKDVCLQKLETLRNFTKNMNTTIIPTSANLNINMDIVCEYICNLITFDEQKNIERYNDNLKMIVIRSFNINKQDVPINELQGGVIGGSIVKGTLRVGDNITLLPGILYKNHDEISLKKWQYRPITSVVQSINSEKTSLTYAVSGGLIGVQLLLDPSLTAQDHLIGSIVVKDYTVNHKVYERIKVLIKLVDNKVVVINVHDVLFINHNAVNINAIVNKITINKKGHKVYELELEKPICVELKEVITISKNLGSDSFEIVGLGKIMTGIESIRL